jgi:hypothetical protein
MSPVFEHEKLNVYQRSLDFVEFTGKDRCRFFDIARGSALECAAALDVLVRRKQLDQDQSDSGKQILKEIVSMIVGLIRSQDGGRAYEDQAVNNEDD